VSKATPFLYISYTQHTYTWELPAAGNHDWQMQVEASNELAPGDWSGIIPIGEGSATALRHHWLADYVPLHDNATSGPYLRLVIALHSFWGGAGVSQSASANR
jgi:hypothetical protein